jgi:3-oxoacyl-[acyl-carrier protein] reductase
MKIDFNGQVALVTGATRGIGKQIAEDFFKLGAKLILTGKNKEQIKILNESLSKEKKKRIQYYSADFTNTKSIEKFIERIRCYDRIDICINNAGINRIHHIDETRIKDWDDIIAVNLKAPFMIMREISKLMKKNGYGRIINISSIYGLISREKRSIYSASKFGIRGLTVATSNELAKYNIFVNTVSPGFVLTDLTKSILSEKEMKELAAQIPARRLASPVDITRVVLFLASSLNTYLTGQNIIVDGGYVNV